MILKMKEKENKIISRRKEKTKINKIITKLNERERERKNE